jgi:hypothetical protein
MLTDLLTSTNESRDHPLLWFPCLIVSGLPLLALKLDLHPAPRLPRVSATMISVRKQIIHVTTRADPTYLGVLYF